MINKIKDFFNYTYHVQFDIERWKVMIASVIMTTLVLGLVI